MKNENILCVIRSAGERTIDICKRLAESQFSRVVIIQENPFSEAVKRTFDVGSEMRDHHYLLALDADIQLFEDASNKIIELCIQQDDGWLRADFPLKDKFRGSIYGSHLYNNKYSGIIRNYLNDPELIDALGSKRPESRSMAIIKKRLGLHNITCKHIFVGKHDFDQYYRHIYAKYYNRAIRDAKSCLKIERCLIKKMEENPEDADFKMALAGLRMGMEMDLSKIALDWKKYPDATNIMNKLMLIEKEPMT